MQKVYFVLNGEEQHYFIEQKNAEKYATDNTGELFEEEIANKKFSELKKQKGFFEDLPEMEIVKDTPSEEKPDPLQKEVERLKKENERLKKQNTLSFEQAAELYKKKADILKKIGTFQGVLSLLNSDIDLTPSKENDLHTEAAELVLNTGGYSKRERFKITNIHVISDFIQFTTDKVNQKIEILKAEVQEL